MYKYIQNTFMYVLIYSATSDAVVRQDPLSMGLSKQEYGVGCHFLFQYMHANVANTDVSQKCMAFFYE